jgi:PEGA domain
MSAQRRSAWPVRFVAGFISAKSRGASRLLRRRLFSLASTSPVLSFLYLREGNKRFIKEGAVNVRTLVLLIVSCCLAVGSLLLPTISYAGDDVLGEIQLQGATKVEKTSGVWIDGQYVGYLKELKGSKKILLLPGEHEIAVHQAGYKDFAQKVVVRPGEKQVIRVAMEQGSPDAPSNGHRGNQTLRCL